MSTLRRRVSRLLGGLAAGALTLAALPAGALVVTQWHTALADPVSQCTTTTGALVVVDFGHWGGPVDVGCAASPSSGYAALGDAGFLTAGTQEWGSAFVCRIGLASAGAAGLRPTPRADPCISTPPANAYWSLWDAPSGATTWSYATAGAQSYVPPAGSIEGWEFGATPISGTAGGPSFSPAQARAAAGGGSGSTSTTTPATVATPPSSVAPATTVAPSPTTAPPAAGTPEGAATTTPSVPSPASVTAPVTAPGAGGGTVAAGTSHPVAGATTVRDTTTTTPASGAARAAQPATATGGAADHRPPDFRIVAASPAAARPTSAGSGPPASFIVGLALLATLLGGGGIVARRRQARRP